jgi:hypothetical protein
MPSMSYRTLRLSNRQAEGEIEGFVALSAASGQGPILRPIPTRSSANEAGFTRTLYLHVLTPTESQI